MPRKTVASTLDAVRPVAAGPLGGVGIEAPDAAWRGSAIAGCRVRDVPGGGTWLSRDELRVQAGFRFEKRRGDWRLGRWAARRAVNRWRLGRGLASLRSESIRILADEGGRPCVHLPKGEPRPNLSISHAGEWGLAACIAPPLAIGCDIERIESRSEAFVGDFFCPSEIVAARSVGPGAVGRRELDPTVVTAIWSAKEAVLKAFGVGLRWDTRSVEVDLSPGATGPDGAWLAANARVSRADRWVDLRWRKAGGWIVTVCVR